MSYTTIYNSAVDTANKLFSDDAIKNFYSQLEQRVTNRPIPTPPHEMEAAIKSEYRSMRLEWIQEEVHEKLVKEFMELFGTFNTSMHREVQNAMIEALTRTHRTIQSDFWADIIAVMRFFAEKGVSEPNRYFDGRNQHLIGIFQKMLMAYDK